MKTFVAILIVFAFASNYADAQSTFSKDRIEEAVKNYLISQTNDDIEVEVVQSVKPISFSEKNIKAIFAHDFRNFKGLGKVTLEFYDGSKKIHSEQIRVKINKFKMLPVSSRVILSGTTIDNSDVVWKRIDVTNYNESELFQSKDIIGKVTKNGIAKDTPFNVKDLSSDMIIKRGQNIYIIAQSGAVQIKTIGTALQNGGVGDFIRVKREGQGNAVLVGEVDMNGAVILRSARASLK